MKPRRMERRWTHDSLKTRSAHVRNALKLPVETPKDSRNIVTADRIRSMTDEELSRLYAVLMVWATDYCAMVELPR